MTAEQPFERRRLRAALKWALQPEPFRRGESNGVVKRWFERKCEGLIACGLSQHTDPIAWECLRLHYVEGRPVTVLSAHFGLSARQIGRKLNEALAQVIDSAPLSVLAALSPASFNWRIDGCAACGGDQYWDIRARDGAAGGEWVCLLCARRDE